MGEGVTGDENGGTGPELEGDDWAVFGLEVLEDLLDLGE